MKPLSFKRHRFPAEVIRHAVWLYFRFNLSFRDGAVSLTLKVLHFEGCKPLVEKAFYETAIV